MSLEKLREEGLRWVEANRSKRFSGVTKLLTDLYPDNAHFIYELLQNAEDARDKSIPNSSGASVVRFTLNDESLEFEHNGEGLFTLEDVSRITGIGDSAKRDDPTSIGKFGIGFKAVFAYTNTPEIHSGEFHFRIHDLVVPETNGLKIPRMGERETRFMFPFDHPKKLPAQATKEIERGLSGLGDNSLLFLRHIRTIEYLLPDGSLGSLERIDHDGGRIEIRANHPGGNDTVSHWLRFQKDVEVVDDSGERQTCRIAIAYRLVEEEEKKKRRSAWKIAPLDHGQVSIYFPAEKETSNLRFHIHAPFASTVARDSVRDCGANQQLRDHLANLVVESLVLIRDQGMLTVGFLAVLPNPADNLSSFYEPIRNAIVHAFQNELLTPTRCGEHAMAGQLYRGPGKIAEVISDDDLSLLTSYDPPLWAASPPQQSQRDDRFLDSLEIDEWGWTELASAISVLSDEERTCVEHWITQKDDAWIMRFYALLGEACDTHDASVDVSDLRIVRVEGGENTEHVIPKEAFFPPDEGSSVPTDVRFIKPTVYSAGRAEERKKFAASFLTNIGVRPFDAKAVIELRLGYYKSLPSHVERSYYKDLRQFMAYWKKNPTEKELFSDYTFLRGVSQDGAIHWYKPKQLCLDGPYVETGLSELAKIHGKSAIWEGYQNELSESHVNDLVSFLRAIGVMYELKVERAPTRNNPHARDLRQDYNCARVKWTSTAIDEDYSIASIDKYIATKAIPASRMIWNAVINADAKSSRARFRPNQQYPIRDAESQLVCHLKRHAWIPDKAGVIRKPQDMRKDDLRTDFPYDDRNGVLSGLGFGDVAKKQSEEYQAKNQVAREMGFVSAEFAEEVARLFNDSEITPDELRSLAAQRRRTLQPEEPVVNAQRRRKGVLERRDNAPERDSVKRERSIQPGTSEVVAQAKAYLRAKYTNPDGQMVCQACQKEMPFRMPSGEYYFEAVQCVRELGQHFFENRLALCPTCSAMYQHARTESDESLKLAIVSGEIEQGDSAFKLEVELAGKARLLRFVGTHFFDLKTVLGE